MLITVHYCRSSCEATWKLQSTEMMENMLCWFFFLVGVGIKEEDQRDSKS